MAVHRVGTGDDPGEGPLDIARVRADDALLDAVHGRHAARGTARADDDLVELLAAWRAEIDAVPVPELVTLDEAVTAVASGRAADTPPARVSRLRRVPLVAAAAMVLALVGLGGAVHGAMPGEALWGVSQVVFSERAESVRNAAGAQESLEQADAAIARRDLPAAASQLSAAGQQIDAVQGEDRATLEAERSRVMSSLPPGAPVAPTPTEPTGTAPGTTTTPDPSGTVTSGSPSATTTAPVPPPAPGTGGGTGGRTPSTTTTTTTAPLLAPLFG